MGRTRTMVAVAALAATAVVLAGCGASSSSAAADSGSTASAKGVLPTMGPPIHPFRAHFLLCVSQGRIWPVGTPAEQALTLLTSGRDYLTSRTDDRSVRQVQDLTRAIDEITAAGEVTRTALDLIEQGCA